MLAYQMSPDISSHFATADIFSTAQLLQQQLSELEERSRMSAESEARRILHRAGLQRMLAEYTAVESAEARATADLAATLARLRSANRTSITQSQSQSQCHLPPLRAPFPFARKLQLGLQTSTPPASPSSQDARRGSPATAPPGAGPGAGVQAQAQARWSGSSPFARLARDALFECSSPRGPLCAARTDADADPRQPTGGLPPTPASPATPMTDAEAALARTLHAFFASDLPAQEPDVSLSSQYSAGPADVSFGLGQPGSDGETGTPTRGARLSLLDPSLRAVALGDHVVTAARGTDVDMPASPALENEVSEADARDSVRASVVAGLSAALAGRLAKATFVRVCARGTPATGRADRLGEHEIGPAAEEMRVDEDTEEAEGEGAGRGRWSRPSLLHRLSDAGAKVHKMKARLSRGGVTDTRVTRSPRRARPAGVYGKCGLIGGQVKLVLVVGRRRMSMMADRVHGTRRSSLRDDDLVAAARDAVREGSFSIESVVAVAESV
ncbi:uncharacterized protein TRAVEDRAFT_49678 [Trametes versicolor FP-101664 SS1]|uniref:uncharacterized protein n=1 Tax=Trametes versicolor (strain FP-101664) TaxID=717944 RepID=UPI000462477B|nr:uncharacterized protein TRAVEDRAFT_49678 [Trametes versicolor FP-101664 SS1]EIW56862.1 hypothetical protein TRAVEDRAFT_49678 [Trametes versicolor FP-101664 SS1]